MVPHGTKHRGHNCEEIGQKSSLHVIVLQIIICNKHEFRLMAESYQKKIMTSLYKVMLVRVLLPGNFQEGERKKCLSKKVTDVEEDTSGNRWTSGL